MKIMFRDVLVHNLDEYEEITIEQLEKFRNESSSDRCVELEEIDLDTNTMFFCLTYY
jgi:hypothetical protein